MKILSRLGMTRLEVTALLRRSCRSPGSVNTAAIPSREYG